MIIPEPAKPTVETTTKTSVGDRNLNSIIQGLLDDSSDESDEDDFLAKYRATKLNVTEALAKPKSPET